MPDFGGTDLDAFRTEARTWLEANFPASLRRDPSAVTDAEATGAQLEGDAALWKQRMGAKGWGVPTWPANLGGGGLSRAEARVLAEEMAAIGAPNPIGRIGWVMLRPTLL